MKKTNRYIGLLLLAMAATACGGNKGAGAGDTLAEAVGIEQAVTEDAGGVAGESAQGAAMAAADEAAEKHGEVLTSLVSNGKPTIVDFNATWCRPCKMMTPIFHKLAAEMGSEYNFVSIDIDKYPELASKYNVQAVPTFIFLDADGKEGNRIQGAVSEETLRDELVHPVWK